MNAADWGRRALEMAAIAFVLYAIVMGAVILDKGLDILPTL